MPQHIEQPSKPINDIKSVINNINVENIADLATILIPIVFAIAANSLKESKERIDNLVRRLNIIHKETIKDILPENYLKRIDQILAQIAILGDYDRVVLGIFHNGVVGSRYSKFEKLAIISSYAVSGIEELPELGKDINIEDIDIDIELLRENNNIHISEIDKLLRESDSNCYMYLKNRNIHTLKNELLTRKGLDLGILSCHYCSDKQNRISQEDENVISELKREIVSIIDVYAQTNKKIKPLNHKIRD